MTPSPVSPVERRVRDYFAKIVHQVDENLTPEIRESFPFYSDDVFETIDQCQVLLDTAFIDKRDNEKDLATMLDYFANRMVVLEKLLENSIPGKSFEFNKTVTDMAFRGIRQTLQRYEVYFPSGDDDDTPASRHL